MVHAQSYPMLLAQMNQSDPSVCKGETTEEKEESYYQLDENEDEIFDSRSGKN